MNTYDYICLNFQSYFVTKFVINLTKFNTIIYNLFN